MPAVSKKQQRFFGYLKAHPAEARARHISGKVVDEFAHAPGGSTKGLPDFIQKGGKAGRRGRT